MSFQKILRWGIEQRLEFIEFRLFWEGAINRADLIGFFGVSVPQASNDLKRYQELAPDNMIYDRNAKQYVASDKFTPVIHKPDVTTYFEQLMAGHVPGGRSWLATVPDFAEIGLPGRTISSKHLRAIVRAIANGSGLNIHYQSLNPGQPEPAWRAITPHAFGFDHLRWHVRAFCHRDERFKDFLLTRILDVGDEAPAAADSTQDLPWQEEFTYVVRPHPELSESQQAVIATDYGMTDGTLAITVRLAMLYYSLKRLGLDFHELDRSPQEQHIVLDDPDAVKKGLAREQSM